MGAAEKTRADEASRNGTLSDTEATLRQVDSVLDDFESRNSNGRLRDIMAGLDGRPAGLKDLIGILESAYGEVVGIIDSLRESRGLLEKAAMERLQSTHAKLAEVSSATEVAATSMLDGLDRSLVLVDALEDLDSGNSPAEGERSGNEIRDEIRDELNNLIGLLQFQDITSQQLGYASGVLLDIEERMVRIAEVFDFRSDEEAQASEIGGKSLAEGREKGSKEFEVCDPEASTLGADSRQALADEIFK
jgi:hypothetical protein